MTIDWHEVRDLVEAGWCKGTYHDYYKYKHSYCLLGAIAQTQSPGNIISWLEQQDPNDPPVELARAFNDLHLPMRRKYFMHAVADYNDRTGTTKQDILELIDRTIEYANQN